MLVVNNKGSINNVYATEPAIFKTVNVNYFDEVVRGDQCVFALLFLSHAYIIVRVQLAIHMHYTPSETNTGLTIDSASSVMDPEFQSAGLEIVWRRRGSTHDGLTIRIN